MSDAIEKMNTNILRITFRLSALKPWWQNNTSYGTSGQQLMARIFVLHVEVAIRMELAICH